MWANGIMGMDMQEGLRVGGQAVDLYLQDDG